MDALMMPLVILLAGLFYSLSLMCMTGKMRAPFASAGFAFVGTLVLAAYGLSYFDTPGGVSRQ